MNSSQIMRLGIMGGTFDPVHYGHLVAAEGARHHFALDRVIFVPAARPPHKGHRFVSPPGNRLAMTKMAVASNPSFQVSDMEVLRLGPSYTIDTVREIRKIFPGAQVYFITGADAVLEILTWRKVEDLLDMCIFIAATRPGYRLENIFQKLEGLTPAQMSRIATMEVPALAISSSDIRRRVREGRPIKYLLPEEVEGYIYSSKLYRD